MSDIESIFEKNYQIKSFHLDQEGKTGLFGILEILQDISGAHASKLGFGYEHSLEKGFFWVLVRQRLEMEHWPNGNKPITVKTWTTTIIGINAIREYELFVDNQKIGSCSTTWVILDSRSRKPKVIENTENLFSARTDYTIGFSAKKILPVDAVAFIRTIEVKPSDLDRNKHVNNIKYGQWILDSFSLPHQQKIMVHAYEINFLAETFLDDHIEIHSDLKKLNPGSEEEVYFKGHRIADDKAVFTAKIDLELFK